jgi:hypothetical protein
MANEEAFNVTRQDDSVIAGPMREPANLEQAIRGSIHDDQMAQKLGLRGGTVAGSLHMEQFPPLLTHIFGQRWWQTGGLSLYFRYATTDRERVQCFARQPEVDAASQQDVRTEVWMNHENGERVADGTASVGKPDMQSTLRQRLERAPTPDDLRILADLEVGQTAEHCPTRAPLDRLEQRLSVIVEPLPDYEEGSPWGGRIAPPSLMVGAMTAVQYGFLSRAGGHNRGVGLWGAIELQQLKGPVFVEHDYEARGTILAVGETPRTEYLWFESILSDPETEDDIASMLMMLRFMKASHPAWQ